MGLYAHSVNGALVGLLIQGHHGGLRNPSAFHGWLNEKRVLPGPVKALEVLRREGIDLASHANVALPEFVKTNRDAELFLRFCYSAFVDADSLDARLIN